MNGTVPSPEASGVVGPSDPLLEMRGVSKAYGGVRALRDVSFDVRAGEIHALAGENGAGKSTLVNALSGAVPVDQGEILLGGERLDGRSPRAIRDRGVAIIHQELNLVPWMTALDNIFLGRELRTRTGSLDRGRMRRTARTVCERLGTRLPLDRSVEHMSVAQQQLIEIAKALNADARLLVMDEPSAVIGGAELERLYAIVRALRAEGTGIVFITHHLGEVIGLADRVTVLKDGARVITRGVAGLTVPELIRHMVGRDVERATPVSAPAGAKVALEVRDVSLRAGAAPVSFDVRAGEVLGVAGLVGSGRTTLAQTVAGLRGAGGGAVTCAGQRVRRTPRSAIGAGIALVPEKRRTQGVILSMSITRNVGLTTSARSSRNGFVRPGLERSLGEHALELFDVRAPDAETAVGQLSGGNQQKVAIAKWLLRDPAPRVLVLDEPTRGVDVGARYEIHQLIQRLAEEGVGILLISSDMTEIMALSGRVVVMRGGTIAGELEGDEIDNEAIGALALGGVDR